MPPDDPSPSSIITTDTVIFDAKAAEKKRKEELTILSKRFGHIPNIPIFTEWGSRIECCNAAVHRSIVAGICGNRRDGAFSVALSGLYEDDEDGGEIIIYTGSGGREKWTDTIPPKRIRLGPQTQDQSWDDQGNRALKISFHTGNPVRVIRSSKYPSKYAPHHGYRYDGLYKVVAVWTANGSNGKKICRARLERLPGQPPIPLKPFTIPASRKKQRRRRRLASGSQPFEDTHSSRMGMKSETLSKADAKAPPEPAEDVADAAWKERLVRMLNSEAVPENLDAVEEHRAEDDVTLVPSEDGHVDAPVNIRMDTEFFSECGDPEPLAA